jgi:hypothetical protein
VSDDIIMIIMHGVCGFDCERKTAGHYEVDETKRIHSYFYIADSLALYIEHLLVINARKLSYFQFRFLHARQVILVPGSWRAVITASSMLRKADYNTAS